MKISKTSRVLSLFHLFRYCDEVSYKEVTDLMPVSEKTVYRDICILKQAGVLHLQFSKKPNAFVLTSSDFAPPQFPENKTQKRYLEKLIRLCTMMVEMDNAEDPILWYRARYQLLTDRTRQRDFAELRKIGYCVRLDYDGYNTKQGHYYCDFPYSTYGLETFETR